MAQPMAASFGHHRKGMDDAHSETTNLASSSDLMETF